MQSSDPAPHHDPDSPAGDRAPEAMAPTGGLRIQVVGLGAWGTQGAELFASRGVRASAVDTDAGISRANLEASRRHRLTIPGRTAGDLGQAARALVHDEELGAALAAEADCDLFVVVANLAAGAGALLAALLKRLEDLAPAAGRLAVARLPGLMSSPEERALGLVALNAILKTHGSSVFLIQPAADLGTQADAESHLALLTLLDLLTVRSGDPILPVSRAALLGFLSTPGFLGWRQIELTAESSARDAAGWHERLTTERVRWQPDGFAWSEAQAVLPLVRAPYDWIEEGGRIQFDRLAQAAWDEAAPCALHPALYAGEPAVTLFVSAGLPYPQGILALRDSVDADRVRLAEKRRGAEALIPLEEDFLPSGTAVLDEIDALSDERSAPAHEEPAAEEPAAAPAVAMEPPMPDEPPVAEPPVAEPPPEAPPAEAAEPRQGEGAALLDEPALEPEPSPEVPVADLQAPAEPTPAVTEEEDRTATGSAEPSAEADQRAVDAGDGPSIAARAEEPSGAPPTEEEPAAALEAEWGSDAEREDVAESEARSVPEEFRPTPVPSAYEEALALVRRILVAGDLGSEVDLGEIRYVLYDLLEVVREEPASILHEVFRPAGHDYFERHHVNVSVLAILTGDLLKGSLSDVIDLGTAALLHDIGMTETRTLWDVDVRLPPKLFDRAVRRHPEAGYRKLQGITGMTGDIARMVLEEHERVDGTGYPDGIAGEAIDPGARILAVCDTLEALTHPRPFRENLTPSEALSRLQILGQYTLDGSIVAALTDALGELLATSNVATGAD